MSGCLNRLETPEDVGRLRRQRCAEYEKWEKHIQLCAGTGCRAFGSLRLREALEEELEHHNLTDKVALTTVGCRGFCERGPLMIIRPEGILYCSLKPEDAHRIVTQTLEEGRVIEELCYRDPATGQTIPHINEIPFYKYQRRNILRFNGVISPFDIGDYIRVGGYEALAKVLNGMSPEEVIEEISKSGLRGRGGAGFPTGLKWKLTRKAPADTKYVICNGDEGDPGAFMDRSVLEGNPHSVIEGLLIAGYAIGAQEGFFYVRAEYPLAIQTLATAISQAEELGLLGESILGGDFSFRASIKKGAGAFVCGEETALIASIEGRRGMPRPRPPFPATSGLWGKPTAINNVETLANVSWIILNGADRFKECGTEGTPGTKIFALTGKVNNTGLVEVPAGATLRDIVFKIGEGIPRGRKFKSAQLGGPSGGCIPARYLDRAIHFESVKEIGAIMGSGGLIVMDDATCMVDIARYFLEFTQKESCGKCVPCRVGTRRMLEILNRITRGEGEPEDIERLERLAEDIRESSLCGLGRTVPNPVLSTLMYFRDEYREHIEEKRCRAGVCEALVKSPCQNACPAGVNVPQYVSLVKLGEFSRACDLVRRRNPFALTCGRICNHPCEMFCRRGDLDEPIAIMYLKRVCAEHSTDGSQLLRNSIRPTGKTVGIIGAGPAGLTAGYFLTLMGHRCTVYEAEAVPGGMLTLTIPSYRLPVEVIQRELEHITSFGLEIKTATAVGRDIAFGELIKQHDALFVGVGVQKPYRLNIPGEQLEGILDGLTMLKEIKFGKRPDVRGRVVVIGGGNVAMDTARTAVRLGAPDVLILYRRTEEEMPASRREIEEAIEEGVKIQTLAVPVSFLGSRRVREIQCVRVRLGEPDKAGRRRPEPIPGSEFTVPADTVIQAIGQGTELTFLEGTGVEINRWGLVETDRWGATSLKGVFAGGDCVTGASTVVEAVAAGQRSAVAIDKFLGGPGILPPNSDYLVEYLPKEEEEVMVERKRPPLPQLEIQTRRKSFSEVIGCYSREVAIEEAKRCLRCDLENLYG